MPKRSDPPRVTVKKLEGDDFGWRDPEWLREALNWISRSLRKNAWRLIDDVEQTYIRPWSTVMRVRTDHGVAWFKANRASLAHEAALVQALAKWAAPRVPTPLSVDTPRGWFLSPDAGKSLEDLLPEHGLGLWEAALTDYAVLQRQLTPHSDDMLRLGVPDCRPEQMPGHLRDLLRDRSRARVNRSGGLSGQEYRALQKLLPRFSEWCAMLSSSGVDSSLQHDDLWEGNVFLSGGGFVFVDWADACIAHPFGSLIYPLRVAAERYELHDESPELLRLRDAYLEPWTDRFDRKSLREISDLAMRIAAVGRALSWERAIQGVGRGALTDYYASGVPRWLVTLIASTQEGD